MTPLETPPRTVPGAPQAPSETAPQEPKNLGLPFVFKGKRKQQDSTLRTLSLSVIHLKKIIKLEIES